MSSYTMTHTGAELDEAIGAVLDNYRDVSPVTAQAADVLVGKVLVTTEGSVTGTMQAVVPPASWRKSVTGSTAAISDGIPEWPVRGVSAQIVPVQTGTGDPSPDNIRPITGATGVSVEVDGTVAVSITFPESPGTVYGGSMNLATGVLTVTHQAYTYDGSESWTVGAITGRDVKRMTTAVPKPLEPFDGTAANFKGLCNMFATGTILSSSTPANTWWYYATGDTNIYFIWDPTTWTGQLDPGVSDTARNRWKKFLADLVDDDTPLTICVPLATPVTYQLQPQVMPVLADGTGTFEADTGPVTVEYYIIPEGGGE